MLHIISRYRIILLICLIPGTPVSQLLAQARVSNVDSTQQLQSEARTNTGKEEDLGRFMGQEPIIERYLSLPYDTVMNVNMPSPFMNIGFLLVIFLPLILLLGKSSNSLTHIIIILLLGIGLLFSVSSGVRQQFNGDQVTAMRTLEQEQTTADGKGLLQFMNHSIHLPMLRITGTVQQAISKYSGARDKITYPILFAGFILLLFLTLRRFRTQDAMTMSMVLLWIYYGFLWLILSGGIAWYGILIFPLGLLFVVYGMIGKAESDSRLLRWSIPLLLGASFLWLVMFFPLRFTGLNPKPDIRGKLPHYPEIVNYQIGNITATAAIEALYPQAQKAAATLNADQTSLIYGIGTFMPFFVEKSDRRIYPDPYLDFFMRLMDEFPDKNELAKALRTYGFEYIILDLQLPSIDKTTDKTLTKKFERFVTFLGNNRHIQVVATDHLVRMDKDGSQVFGIGMPEPHSTVRGGRFAVYRLL